MPFRGGMGRVTTHLFKARHGVYPFTTRPRYCSLSRAYPTWRCEVPPLLQSDTPRWKTIVSIDSRYKAIEKRRPSRFPLLVRFQRFGGLRIVSRAHAAVLLPEPATRPQTHNLFVLSGGRLDQQTLPPLPGRFTDAAMDIGGATQRGETGVVLRQR